jgi:1-aminocyclopropane-1-carboxylate deaminase/D-cysteine desulfhydrase-like pyridoxal-dependent ACC family enzyme
MLQLISDKRIKPDSNILFIHTGGTPGIYTKEHLEHIKKELW